MTRRSSPAMGAILYFMSMLLLGLYFAFAAIQGDYGLFRGAEIEAEARSLRAELQELDAEVLRLENLTHRLSDDFLDLDLLDERARDMLGMIRNDEIVIR